MINFGKEYFINDMYFFLKKRENHIDLYYSEGKSLNEARNMDEIITLPLTMENTILSLVEKVTKSKKKFKKDDIKKLIDKIKGNKEEMDEIIDFDGSFSNSKIPIHDPKLSPTKTMDQTVYSVAQAGDPVKRGYRVYYGESVVKEEDFSGAFGYDVVSGDTYEDCVEKMKQMEVENPEERCQTFGKSPKLDKKGQERLTEKEIKEAQRQKMIGMLEDLIVTKGKDNDVQKKEVKASKVFLKNLNSLKKQAEKEGLSISDLIKLMKSE
jgi:hypothetical protein